MCIHCVSLLYVLYCVRRLQFIHVTGAEDAERHLREKITSEMPHNYYYIYMYLSTHGCSDSLHGVIKTVKILILILVRVHELKSLYEDAVCYAYLSHMYFIHIYATGLEM